MSPYIEYLADKPETLRKLRKEQMEKHLEKVASIQIESRAFAPVRFMEALEDYENWLTVQLKELG